MGRLPAGLQYRFTAQVDRGASDVAIVDARVRLEHDGVAESAVRVRNE